MLGNVRFGNQASIWTDMVTTIEKKLTYLNCCYFGLSFLKLSCGIRTPFLTASYNFLVISVRVGTLVRILDDIT